MIPPSSPGRAGDGALQPCQPWALVITLISEQLGAPLDNPSQHRTGHGAGRTHCCPTAAPLLCLAQPSRQPADLCCTKGKLFWTRGESAG